MGDEEIYLVETAEIAYAPGLHVEGPPAHE